MYIVESGLVDEHTVVSPHEACTEDLLMVHSKSYLENLKVCFFFDCSYPALDLSSIAQILPSHDTDTVLLYVWNWSRQ